MMRNVIFDLGGVVLDWNPDAILEHYYADMDARAAMRTALFQHPDWLLMDRGVFSEAEVIARLEERTGRDRAELTGLLDAVRYSLDDHRPNIDAAQALGMHTVWFRDAGQCEAELERLLP